MEIIPLKTIDHNEWDEAISKFDNHLLFHRSAWLSFLQETQQKKVVRFKIVENGRIHGYLAGILLNKFGLKILGSPLSIWFTDYMGPIVNNDFDQEAFLSGINRLRRRLKIHSIELASPCLDHDLMQKSGFKCHTKTVYEIPLSTDRNDMWESLSGKCRNRIRKGMKNGLVAEECSDPGFVDEFYDQLREVFAKQGHIPQYPVHIMRSLYKNLKDKNLLFTLRVRHGEQTIASGLFPHDNRFVFSFGIASRTKFQHLCPNELLYWTIISMAGKLGLKKFCIGGLYRSPQSGGIFKKKFNGSEIMIRRYSKDYSAFARVGRKIYRFVYYMKQAINNRMAHVK
jgi:hypothetical protein